MEAKIEVELSNGAKAGQTLKELGKQANTLNKELKDLRPGTEAFVKKAADLKVVEERMSGIKSQIKGTTEASNTLKDSFDKFVPFAGQFKSVGESMGFVTKGVGGLSSSFGLLRGAIISTGIGALIVLLGSLIAYFTSTQEGIDKVTAVTRPLQAVFTALMKVLQDLGGKVFKQFETALQNPMQAIKDLGKAILENLINRFKAFTLIWPAIKKIFSGDLKGGFKDLGNAALQAASGVENVIDKVQAAGKAIIEMSKAAAEAAQRAWEIGQRIDALQKAIEKSEIDQIKRSKQLDLLIKQQKFLLEDVTRSWDDRRASAKAALAAQEKLLNLELNLMDMKIQKMRLEHSLGNVTREQQKQLAELEAQRFEKEAQITEQRIEFRNKLIEIDRGQAAELLAILNNLEDLRIEKMKEGQEKEIALLNIAAARKISVLKGTEDQIIEQLSLMAEIREQQLQSIRDKYELEASEKADKSIADRLSKQQQALDEELGFWDQYFFDRQLLLLQSLATGEITQKTYNEQAYENQLEFLNRQLALLEENGQKETLAYKQIQEQKLMAELDALDRIKNARQQNFESSLATAQNFTGAMIDNYRADSEAEKQKLENTKERFGEESEQYKKALKQYEIFQQKNGERIKRAEKAQVGINLVGELSAIWKNSAEFGPFGYLLAAAQTAAALIRAQAAYKNIEKEKFQFGGSVTDGVLKGKSHAQGGIPIEAEGDEIILAKGVYRNKQLRAEASRLNVLGGGRSFASGGPVSPFRDRPPVARGNAPVNTSGTATSQNDALNEMRGMINDLVAAQDRRIDRLKVYNVATETQEINDDIKRIKNEADV